MVNYNLEEFRAWLEEKPERKEGLTEHWNAIFVSFMPDYFQGFIGGHKGTAVYFRPYRQIVLKWKAEVDERERERERANSGEGEDNMFKNCAKCGQHKQIPPTETLCYTCREKEESMIVCIRCQKQVGSWPTIPGQFCFECHPAWWAETQGKLEQLTQLQTKLTTYLTHRKSSLTHEIQLIKEALND